MDGINAMQYVFQFVDLDIDVMPQHNINFGVEDDIGSIDAMPHDQHGVDDYLLGDKDQKQLRWNFLEHYSKTDLFGFSRLQEAIFAYTTQAYASINQACRDWDADKPVEESMQVCIEDLMDGLNELPSWTGERCYRGLGSLKYYDKDNPKLSSLLYFMLLI